MSGHGGGPSRHHGGHPGPGRFRWRLAAAAALAALPALIPAAPAGAASAARAAGPGVNGTFGITPAPARDGRAAPYFMMALAAGDETAATAIVTNHGQTKENLKISRSTGVTAANGGSSFSQSFERCSGTGCWVTRLPAEVTLPGGTSEIVPFTVHVPAGTPAGQYLAGISVELARKPQPVQVGSNGQASARAIIIEQVTVGVAVTVGSLSQMTTRLLIQAVSGAAFGRLARLNIVLDNPGQTFATAAGNVSCTAAGKGETYSVFAPTILPHDHAMIAANAPGLPEGSSVPCTVRLHYGHGQTASWQGLVTVPVPPAVRIVHTGQGAYSVIPAAGIPAWAIALIVIGALVLVTMAVLLFRARQHRRHA